MEPRFLFPDLPAELRNIIYAETTSPSQPASQAGLPFTSKTYTFSHTTVTMMPIHRGLPTLLALRKYRFQEAGEYASYLLANALTLRITILFHGHMSTFIQSHWDAKIATHLKNLLKKYPWLAKVVDYNIRIVWEPKLVSGKKRREIGGIAKRMVEVLTSMADAELKRKRGSSKVELQVGVTTACEYVGLGQALGLKEFVRFPQEGWRTQGRKVTISPAKRILDSSPHSKKHGFGEVEEWECRVAGRLFFETKARSLPNGTVTRAETITKPRDGDALMMGLFPVLIQECPAVADEQGA
jgi:hypothetical protein